MFMTGVTGVAVGDGLSLPPFPSQQTLALISMPPRIRCAGEHLRHHRRVAVHGAVRRQPDGCGGG